MARFRERWTEQDLNEARLRMARVPDGAELIQSATILAPGFKLGNVIVMAGIPSIMQAMMDIVAPKLKSGVRMLSESVRANVKDDDFIILLPAFVSSELTRAFEIGFLLFLPFLIIDIIVSNILMAMGMMMVSPTLISLPLKLFLFVAVDGWSRLMHGLILSYDG